MNRLLVIGAGATIEESSRSGNDPSNPDFQFPTINNFCKLLFNPTASSLLQVTASYLADKGIDFDNKMLNLKPGDSFSSEDIKSNPTNIFIKLEESNPHENNIELLCEYAWEKFGANPAFWDDFIYNGIFFHLFATHSTQFGMGIGKPMIAGMQVANTLISGDAIISLNYDIAFDLALVQAKKEFVYSPAYNPFGINLLKPHGSINLRVNHKTGDFYFQQPNNLSGSVNIQNPLGTFTPYGSIVPPRLNKNYTQHPISKMILSTGRPFNPNIVTFWGVGLTQSDIDLLEIYKEASENAKKIEFINPSKEAHKNAVEALWKNIRHYKTLDEWLAQAKI